MTRYAFFISKLRFVADRTSRESGDVFAMMRILDLMIRDFEAGAENFFVPPEDLKICARALAGVAGFYQQHILPEVLAAQNSKGEREVRWTIDTCMTMMSQLLTHAELRQGREGLLITLPPPL